VLSQVIAVIIPLLIFFLYFLRRRSILDFHNAFLGMWEGVFSLDLANSFAFESDSLASNSPDYFPRSSLGKLQQLSLQ
jgi:hypothetical protein